MAVHGRRQSFALNFEAMTGEIMSLDPKMD
jgi:hypothetical protein